MIADLPYKSMDLKKHVAAIHSANKLSLVQRKIANALLFNAYHELAEKEEHHIHIRTLCSLIGYNSNELNAIKKALVSLISTVVEWNLVDKERCDQTGVWNASAIIADASIAGSVCTYSYSHKMRQLLFRPEMYGRLNMQVQAQFNSSYGLVLYENCVRYQNIKETPWFDMSLFRKLMGVDEGKYSVFKDFRKRVIDIAVKEVNQHSGFSVEYMLKKIGRTPLAIKFSVNPRQVLTTHGSPMEEILHHEFAFSKQQAIDAVADFGEHYIAEKVALVKSSASYKKKAIHHLAAYMHSALKQDYKEPIKNKRAFVAKEKNNVSLPSIETSTTQALRYEDILKQEKMIDHFYQRPIVEQEQYIELFMKVIHNTIYETLFARDGLNNTIVSRKFTQFLRSCEKKRT